MSLISLLRFSCLVVLALFMTVVFCVERKEASGTGYTQTAPS